MIKVIYRMEIISDKGVVEVRRYFRNKRLAERAAKSYEKAVKRHKDIFGKQKYIDVRKMSKQDMFWVKESEVEE